MGQIGVIIAKLSPATRTDVVVPWRVRQVIVEANGTRKDHWLWIPRAFILEQSAHPTMSSDCFVFDGVERYHKPRRNTCDAKVCRYEV
jgi:hypothetical protein